MPPQEAPDISELSIARFHTALREGTTTCEAVVDRYLTRIAQYDSTLKTLIRVNENAKSEAATKDKETRQYQETNQRFPAGRLHGVPLIVKDNFSTRDLPTSAGVRALQTLQTYDDSKAVALLRDSGAIILAKANLHELALQGTTTSSLGGQTLNPYDLGRTPGGSSGGTGAALAADLGLVGCGTDTVNSLRSPASACAVVGFRPARGSVSGRGVVPVSETQDAAGPMARSVADVRILYEVMAGRDNPQTMPLRIREAKARQEHPWRVGVVEAYFELESSSGSSDDNPDLVTESTTVQSTIRTALAAVQERGDITLIPIDTASHGDWSVATLLVNADTQSFEFQECLDSFLQSAQISTMPHCSLASIAASGEYEPRAVTDAFTAPLDDPGTFCLSSAAYKDRLANIASLKESVSRCFEEYGLDALVYPHQRHLVVPTGTMAQPGRNGALAALTGRPAICIPAGFSPATSTAPRGVPIGLELMGRDVVDDELLGLAEHFERILQARRAPDLSGVDKKPNIEAKCRWLYIGLMSMCEQPKIFRKCKPKYSARKMKKAEQRINISIRGVHTPRHTMYPLQDKTNAFYSHGN